MSTISGTVNQSITLGNGIGSYFSPLTITSTGSVSNNGSGDAIFGPAGYAGTWVVSNQGQVSASGGFDGIDLKSPGSVSNTGAIQAANANAVYLGAGGNVTNYGRIADASTSSAAVSLLNAPANLVNTGSISSSGNTGIYLNAGGSVTNQFLGVISGRNGVYAIRAATYVTNSGSIQATTGIGVYLAAGGSITNAASGLISNNSARSAAVSLLNPATLVNAGRISSSGNSGVYVDKGGSVTNQSGGTISGGLAGVSLAGSVAVTVVNQGTISGGAGVLIDGTDTAANTIDNGGIIASTGGAAGTAVAFGGGNDLLRIEPGSQLTGALSNFHVGTTIDLVGMVANSATYANHILTLQNGSATVATLQFSGDFNSASFVPSSDGNFGTDITTTIADFLIYNQNTGDFQVGKRMDTGNTHFTDGGILGAQFQFKGTGDFLGDGRDGFLLYTPSTGRLDVKETNAGFTQTIPVGVIGSSNAFPGAPFQGTGDFVGNGRGQVLIRDPSKILYIEQPNSSGVTNTFTLGNPGSTLSVVGTGDYLGKGHAQVLLEDGFGNLSIDEYLAGAAQVTAAGAVNSSFQFKGTGDYLGDDRAQFLLYNPSTGEMDIGEKTSAATQSQLTNIGFLGGQWQFVGSSDFLGDGRADFLIYNQSTGEIDIGERKSTGYTHFTSLGTLGSQWQFEGTGHFLGNSG